MGVEKLTQAIKCIWQHKNRSWHPCTCGEVWANHWVKFLPNGYSYGGPQKIQVFCTEADGQKEKGGRMFCPDKNKFQQYKILLKLGGFLSTGDYIVVRRWDEAEKFLKGE